MSDRTGFSSKTLAEHLARGAGGAGLVALAIWLLASPDFLKSAIAVVAFVGAVALLRGCPMCWFVGLIETMRNRVAR